MSKADEIMEQMIQSVAKTFVDRYSLERCKTQSDDDNYLDISAIALATAEAALKAVKVHTKASRYLQK
jgi:hypothetical protein